MNTKILREIKVKEKTDSKHLSDIKNEHMKNNFNTSLFPNSIVFMIISNLDYNSLIKNQNFNKFYESANEKNNLNRLYKIKSHSNELSNWFSYFSGMKPELTGINGNTFSHIDETIKIDSIFSKIQKKNIKNKIYGMKNWLNFLISSYKKIIKLADRNFIKFIRRFYPSANIHNFHIKSNEILFDDDMLLGNNMMNDITDERKFQELIKDISENQKIKRNFCNNSNNYENIKEPNHLNDIYFSNDLSIVHFGKNTFH